MTTAIEQFAQDYTLIIDNNQEAYNEARECASTHTHPHEVSDCMREQYEEVIESALDVLRSSGEVQEVVVDLMAQLLNGWGEGAFGIIARHYMEKE